MIGAVRALFEAMVAAQRDGWGAIFVLWLLVLAAMSAAVLALRAYRSANDARINAISERLDDCERKHEWQSQALEQARMRHDRLQRKLALVTGLLIARLGSHSLPDDFLRIILDEDSEGLPEYDLASAA